MKKGIIRVLLALFIVFMASLQFAQDMTKEDANKDNNPQVMPLLRTGTPPAGTETATTARPVKPVDTPVPVPGYTPIISSTGARKPFP